MQLRIINEFDEVDLVAGPIKSNGSFTKLIHVEGKLSIGDFDFPENRSTLEVFKNYEMSLNKAGFQVVFSCSPKDCGTGRAVVKGIVDFAANSQHQWDFRYLLAKWQRNEGDVYVAVKVRADHSGGGPPYNRKTNLLVVEMKPMQEGLVSVNATALADDLKNSGHASVYGILFDFDKAEIRSESVIGEIAKLLQQNKELKLHVVGHTDNVGTFEHNLDLSKRRAVSVVNSLVTKYSVNAARLRADGIGPLSPVTTNKTEDGRSKNRRVELVEQ
ncbi:MAG: OmpA family protein [Deltaproteobacteria bacterium]|nr:OmpA family protein [Deltaproteobacteria bacterium]